MTPVFLITGLLESGKTTLVKNMFLSSDFRDNGPTLLILTEEGEEEYDREFLSSANLTKVVIDDKEKLTPALLKNYEALYRPRQVVVEYNGTWEMDKILEMELPQNWGIASVYSTVNCESAMLYLLNMRKLFMEPLSVSSLIIFNRYTDDIDRGMLRRNIKALNMMAQVVFEREDGSVVEETEEDLPFDVTRDVIEIEDDDFGTWFVDSLDHPEHYKDKKIKTLAQVYTSMDLPPKTFVPGRFCMTCCADDIQFLGHECRVEDVKKFKYKTKDWVKIVAEIKYEFNFEYGEEVPVLYLESIEKAKKPKEEVVYFA